GTWSAKASRPRRGPSDCPDAKRISKTEAQRGSKRRPPNGRPSSIALEARLSAVEHLGDRRAQVTGRLHGGHARLLQRGELALGRARAARGDRAGVAHALARRRAGAGDEADHRLGHVLGDELRGLFLGAAADLADHDDALALLIVLAQA